MFDHPDLVVVNAAVYTCRPDDPWASAFAVSGGRFTAVGSDEEIRPLAGPATHVVDAGGRMILPGLCDVHTHLGLGGSQAAWELPIAPTASEDEIYRLIAEWSAELGPDEWVVGGIVGSTVLDVVANVDSLARLDEASGGRPVLLRDDSMHNRWVNNPALAAMGVTAQSPDPEGGTYVRDRDGRLTGVLWESATAEAENTLARSFNDPAHRMQVSVATAVSLCNSFGITTVQDAATMESALHALSNLEHDGKLSLRVVASTPERAFLEPGITGPPLIDASERYRSELIRPDFVKVFLDGVPMTRTSAMISPYLAHSCRDGHSGAHETGECLYKLDELVDTLEHAVRAGRGVKIHATGDASTRLALDAVAVIRQRHGEQPRFQIAHTEFIDDADLPRFADLGVVADASPYIWYPGVIQESIAKQVPSRYVETSWPLRDLLGSGANVSAGSDWPCALPSPVPWTGLEALVTRRNPETGGTATLNEPQKLTLDDAIATFTRYPAQAMGLDNLVGSITPGLSADFVVIDRNLFDIEPTEIHHTQVEQTYLRGRQVYPHD